MSSNNDPSPRQPPRFVPTLTDMVSPAMPSPAERVETVEPTPPLPMPPVFASVLKDWPTLGPTPTHSTPAAEPQAAEPGELADALAIQSAQIARRAEALVLQRLPDALAGLVAEAVQQAMKEAMGQPLAPTPSRQT